MLSVCTEVGHSHSINKSILIHKVLHPFYFNCVCLTTDHGPTVPLPILVLDPFNLNSKKWLQRVGRGGLSPQTASLSTYNIHYTRIAARPIPPPFTFYGTRAIRRAKHAGIACGARSQLRRCLAPLLNLHKVEKFQLYANASGANPRGHQSANRTWAWGPSLTPSASLPQCGRELVDPLVNTPSRTNDFSFLRYADNLRIVGLDGQAASASAAQSFWLSNMSGLDALPTPPSL